MIPPLFHLNLGVFPFGQIADIWVNVSSYLKLFGREIIFRSIPSYVIMVPERRRRTDGQTTYCGITAL